MVKKTEGKKPKGKAKEPSITSGSAAAPTVLVFPSSPTFADRDALPVPPPVASPPAPVQAVHHAPADNDDIYEEDEYEEAPAGASWDQQAAADDWPAGGAGMPDSMPAPAPAHGGWPDQTHQLQPPGAWGNSPSIAHMPSPSPAPAPSPGRGWTAERETMPKKQVSAAQAFAGYPPEPIGFPTKANVPPPAPAASSFAQPTVFQEWQRYHNTAGKASSLAMQTAAAMMPPMAQTQASWTTWAKEAKHPVAKVGSAPGAHSGHGHFGQGGGRAPDDGFGASDNWDALLMDPRLQAQPSQARSGWRQTGFYPQQSPQQHGGKKAKRAKFAETDPWGGMGGMGGGMAEGGYAQQTDGWGDAGAWDAGQGGGGGGGWDQGESAGDWGQSAGGWGGEDDQGMYAADDWEQPAKSKKKKKAAKEHVGWDDGGGDWRDQNTSWGAMQDEAQGNDQEWEDEEDWAESRKVRWGENTMHTWGGSPAKGAAPPLTASGWGAVPKGPTSATMAFAAGGSPMIGVAPTKIQAPTDVRIVDGSGISLQSLRTALYGQQRPASKRIYWGFSPFQDPKVHQNLTWVSNLAMEVVQLGLHKFVTTRQRGALFSNVSYKLANAHDIALDWLPLAQLQATRDKVLQESAALYDPTREVVVFICLLSPSRNSMAVWRRRFPIPEALVYANAKDLEKAMRSLPMDMSMNPVYVDELSGDLEEEEEAPPPPPKKKRRFFGRSGDDSNKLQRNAAVHKRVQLVDDGPVPLPPDGEPKKKKKGFFRRLFGF